MHVQEKHQKGYKVHELNVPTDEHWDTESYKVEDNKVTVNFLNCDDARAKVVVVNKKDKKDDCGGK